MILKWCKTILRKYHTTVGVIALLLVCYGADLIQIPVFISRIAAHSYWYWLISNQEAQSIETFFSHADRIITLDPHFVLAYRYSFIYGTVWHNRPDLARLLISKAKQSVYTCTDEQICAYARYCGLSSLAVAVSAGVACEAPCV
ncbi:MAG: hypothetical protein WCE21_04235 [Candidatus Babeliales bacterium]